MKVLITIPAYNEEKTIGPVLNDINNTMKNSGHQFKILVVNDGSKDQTAAIAKEKGALVVSHPKNMGLAETFRTEMRECLKMNFDVIVHTDADGQYRAEDIPRLVEPINKGYDLVLGSRFAGKIESMPLIKRVGNRAFSKVISNITKTRISDGQTGFRAFNRSVAENIKISSTHTYTQEQIIRAANQKYRIKEIPIFFAKRGANTQSRLMSNPFEYAAKAWVNILRIYRDYDPLKFFGTVGLVLFSIGFIIGLWLFSLFIRHGRIGHIPLTIFSMLLMLSAIQIILFGFLADMQRK